MASGRALYRLVAEAAIANARQLLRDAKKLKSLGSRGHACSLAILSIEESAKALVYYTASEGVYRLVKRKPNYFTTFRKKDLMDHRFKHAIISAFLADWIFYLPFYSVLESKRKSVFSRSQVEELLQKAMHAHRRQRIELASGGRAARELNKTFSLLESLNEKKNKGFYVDHSDKKTLIPDGISRREVSDLLNLADTVTEMVSEIVTVSISREQKKVLIEEARKLARQIRKMKRKAKEEASE